jgi:hypothetical protein
MKVRGLEELTLEPTLTLPLSLQKGEATQCKRGDSKTFSQT